jgi:hypothetical protein
MQPMLGSPFQKIGGAPCPFRFSKVARLAFVEISAKMASKIRAGTGRPQQLPRARAVQTRAVVDQRLREIGIVTGQIRREIIKCAGNVAAGKRLTRSPRRRQLRKPGSQALQRMFRQPAIGGDLAAEDRKQRRKLGCAVDLEDIVPRYCRRILRIIVIERPNTGESMNDIAILRCVSKIAAQDLQQIRDLGVINRHFLRTPIIGNVGRADQSQIVFIRIDEDDAAIVVLQQLGMRPAPEFRHHDMAAFDEPHVVSGIHAGYSLHDVLHPGSSRIDEHAGLRDLRAAILALHLK